ncbi:MAG TPA: translocation/assembly module TamB domain-containing protein, partial [Cyclobacteriaceae bacterium]
KGEVSNPAINGSLTFKDATIVPSAVNSAFILKEETLTIKESGLVFSDFTIRDEKNNTASIDGTIGSANFKSFRLNLDVKANDFQMLNSTYADNKLFYGKVTVTTQMRIHGSASEPRVNMDVSLGDKSNFTFVVPQSEKGVQDQKGIVTFVDKDADTDPFLAGIKPNDTLVTAFKGVDLTANIELSGGETFNIVLDPASGDQLSVRGKSDLTLKMDPAGEMQLTGRYEIVSGTYDFSFYKLVKRNFIIEKGSVISWLGDPMEAQLDIRAIYKIETSPMELVSNQIEIVSPTELNTYRQRLPFLVYLMIKGDMLTPEITFKLDMPVDKQNAFGGNIYATIQDLNTRESDLNKQVFALLVLKRFITENPLESQSGGDTEGTARSSVSRVLTDQLNRLSENVKGVQLSFDVKSYQDYSTGTAQGQTQLQLGVSKTLFNDRLVVKVSGNLDIEGENASQQHSAADYIGDLALEYKVTGDGRIRISGFRNSNYDMIDGELTETGAGLIYIKDYNTLSELFKANEKENN